MDTDMPRQLAALEQMTTGELCSRYLELFGQSVRTRHKQYLIRKIAWRIQALAEGGLSERARRRAEELANDADIRLMPPRSAPLATGSPGSRRLAMVGPEAPRRPLDPRLPMPGTALVRQYKGRQIRIIVHSDGFEYLGQRYKTLTAVAQAITGSHMNGYRFFGLENKP